MSTIYIDMGTLAVMAATVPALTVTYLAWRRQKSGPVANSAECPCGHGINYHEDLTGRCRSKRDKVAKYNPSGHPIAWTEVDCDCQVYAGPELLRGLTGQTLVSLPPPVKPAITRPRKEESS